MGPDQKLRSRQGRLVSSRGRLMQGCPRITPAGQGNPTTYKELRVGKKRRALSRRLIARRGGGVQLMATVHLARMQSQKTRTET